MSRGTGLPGRRGSPVTTMLRRALLTLTLVIALSGAGPVTSAPALELPAQGCVHLRASVSDAEARALPFANSDCPGARPGAGYHVSLASGTYRCSLAFMFEGSDGKRYFSTAGHCLLDDTDPEEKTWASGTGPSVRDMQGRPFGRGVYARLDGQFDIGMIEIDPASSSPVSPQVCHFGGPTSLGTRSITSPPEVVHHYGYGATYKDVLRARTGTVADHLPANYYRMESNVAGGDSGSSLIADDGAALGIVVRGLTTGAGVGEASRLDTHLELAEAGLGIDLTLVTAPLLGL